MIKPYFRRAAKGSECHKEYYFFFSLVEFRQLRMELYILVLLQTLGNA